MMKRTREGYPRVGGKLLWILGMVGALTACEKAKSDTSASASAERTQAARREVSPFSFAEPRIGVMRLVSSTTVTSQPNPTELNLTGRLALLPVQGGMRAILLEPKVTLGGQEEPTLTGKLASMARGSVWHFDGGSLESMSLPEGTSPEAKNFWRTLASAFQYVPSLQGTSAEVDQYDSTGKHTARYEWASGALKRKKLAYKDVLQSGGKTASLQQLEPHIVLSETNLTLRDDSLVSLSSKEQVRTDLQKGVTLDVTTELSLSLSSLAPEDAAFSQLKAPDYGAGFSQLKASEPIELSHKLNQAEFDELRIKDWTFEDALDVLVRDAGNKQSRAARPDDEKRRIYSAYSAVTAYLRSVPGKVEEAQKLLGSKPEAAAALLSPLSDAGTPGAQELLLRFAEDTKMPLTARSFAIIQIGQTKEPVPALVPGLLRLIQVPGLRQQALYNLGTLGRRFRDAGHVEEFNKVSAAIEAELDGVSSERPVGDVLGAISNLGDERLLPRVLPYLSSPDVKVRGDAVLALRHMKSPEVDPLIAGALSIEKTKLALLTVLIAMNIREPLPMHKEALQALLARPDLEGQVRGRAQHLLDSWQNL